MSKTVADVPVWFSGCRLNFAENLLRYQEDKTAVITCGESTASLSPPTSHGGYMYVSFFLFPSGEGQEVQQFTFSQLRERVATIAAALAAMGVAKGDIVAGEASLGGCLCAVRWIVWDMWCSVGSVGSVGMYVV